jgi:hypothetical protein
LTIEARPRCRAFFHTNCVPVRRRGARLGLEPPEATRSWDASVPILTVRSHSTVTCPRKRASSSPRTIDGTHAEPTSMYRGYWIARSSRVMTANEIQALETVHYDRRQLAVAEPTAARVSWSGPKSSALSIERIVASRLRARLTRLLMVPTAQPQICAASS